MHRGVDVENSNYALVLTGEVLPGYSPEAVWPALAAYFRMEPDRFNSQLLARAPLSIKQGDDLGKLQTLQAGAAAVGAATEICAPDGRPALFVLIDNKPRGPVPHVLVEEHVEHGFWPASTTVAEVGSTAWRPFAEISRSSPRAEPAASELPFDAEARMTTDHSTTHAPTHAPDRGHNLAGVASSSTLTANAGDAAVLPPGLTIHAGFWRRCAALLIDGLLIGGVMAVVQAIIGLGALGVVQSGQADVATVFGAMSLLMVVAVVAQWLYFALFQSSTAQATPGKMAMGIKVVDDCGRRIGFGRASGRFFGKFISGMVFNIGYLMAGFTERKQALHDMIAGTLVVFKAVQPGRPLPQTRPPMPWYGWLINILIIGSLALGLLAMMFYAGTLLKVIAGSMQAL